jgi:hypothetical protein
MRTGAKLLIALGAADLLIAMGAMMLHSMAFASQYAGLVVWVCQRTPGVEDGSAEHEEMMSHVLNVLGRTQSSFFAVLIALAVSGVVLIVVGARGCGGSGRGTGVRGP